MFKDGFWENKTAVSGSLGEGLEGLALRRRSTAATVNRQPSVREEARGLGTVGSLGALQTMVRSTDFSLRGDCQLGK